MRLREAEGRLPSGKGGEIRCGQCQRGCAVGEKEGGGSRRDCAIKLFRKKEKAAKFSRLRGQRRKNESAKMAGRLTTD